MGVLKEGRIVQKCIKDLRWTDLGKSELIERISVWKKDDWQADVWQARRTVNDNE